MHFLQSIKIEQNIVLSCDHCSILAVLKLGRFEKTITKKHIKDYSKKIV
jgi:hypothetical protein